MHTNKIRTLGAVIAATAILAGCTTTTADSNTPSANSSSQAPTSTPAPTPSSASSTLAPASSTPSTRPPSSTPPPSTTPKPTTTTTSREPTSSSAPPTTIETSFPVTVPGRWRGPEYDSLVSSAITSYKGMQETWAAAQVDPSGKDWVKEMSKYLADPALTQWAVKAYKPLVENNLKLVGRVSATATVTNVVVKPPSGAVKAVRFRVCTDGRSRILVDGTGNVVPGPKDSKPTRGLSEFYVELLPAGWRIRLDSGLSSTGKSPSC